MAKEIIRQDIIEVSLKSNDMLDSLGKINDEISRIKKLFGILDDDEPFEKTKKQANKTKEEMEKTRKESEKLKDSLEKVGKTSFNKVISGLKKVGIVTVSASKAAAKVTVASVGAASAGVVALVGSSVKAYGDYEQLVGGVDTLFKNSSTNVQKYANDAYKTAGLSANDYMETVTSFSASLLQSVNNDTAKAANIANQAIVDMSDNANKMGTVMESIQYAYQGFAKQNYTMLDNLKLGYGGTKEEMKRLIKDAAKVDKSINANSMSYANIINAIHIIQNTMGITGTTAREASTTIQGSFSSLKSAWGNLMTSLVVGGNSFDQCLFNFVDSAKTFGDNVMPAIRKGLSGVGDLIVGLIPYIETELPGLIDELLPPLLKAATALIKGLIKSLPSIIKILIKELPDVVKQIGQAITETLGTQMPSLGKFGEAFIQNANIIAKIIPVMLGGVVAFKVIKPIVSGFGSVSKMFGKSDKSISKMKNPLGNIAKTNVKTILKGMTNIAIIVGGFTMITTAVMAVSPYISQLSNMKSFLKITSAITVLGIVGTELAGVASLAGKIPVTTVLKGFANIAIMVAGMSTMFAVVGLVSNLNFNYKKMLEMVKMMGILTIVGGAAAAFAAIVGLLPIPTVLIGLANIALVIGGLTAIVAAFGALSKISGINDFIKSGGELLANIFCAIGKVAGSLIGGIGEGVTNMLPIIGENLTKFSKSVEYMFTMFKGVDVAGIGSFFKAIGSFIILMAGNDILSIFTGGFDFDRLGTQLAGFADGSESFFTKVSTFPKSGFKNADMLFKSLKNIGNIPNTGGVAQWFSGENDLSGLAKNLPVFGEGMAKFYASISGISDFGRIESLFNSLKSASGISSITELVTQNIDEIVKKISDLPQKMAKALESSGKSLSTALVKIWKDAVTASAAPVNKLLDGANWILTQFGSSKRVARWTPYARGTDGHKGGNALVNDGRGAELIQMPNGDSFIPTGKNVLMPNAPKGMKVLSAENTAKLMGRKSPTFKYAKGNIDIWDYIDNEVGLVGAVTKKYVNYKGLKGTILNIGKGFVSTVGGEMTSWVKKMFNEFGALSLANYNPSAGVNQWKSTVIRALKMEGQYSDANVARTLYQMQTESGGNPKAINLWDSNAKKGIPSKGLMQVIDPTFRAYARAGFNSNIYDPLSNILASIRYAIARYGSLAKAYQGHGYANGGIATKPSIFGEAGPEMAIPLTSSKRNRALGLWERTGSILGAYTPENSHTLRSTNNSHTTYVCNFNITVNGGDNSRQTARSTKRAVKEAFKEFMNDFNNNNKPLREW